MEALEIFQTKEFKNLLTCLETNCKMSLNNDLRKFGNSIKNMNQKNPEKMLKMMTTLKALLKKMGKKDILTCQIQKCAKQIIAYQIKASRMSIKQIEKTEKLLKGLQKQM